MAYLQVCLVVEKLSLEGALRMCDVRWASSANLALDKGLADLFSTEMLCSTNLSTSSN